MSLLTLLLARPVAVAGPLEPAGNDPYELWAALCDNHRTRARPIRFAARGRLPARSVFVLCADLRSESTMVGPSTFNRVDQPMPHSEILLLVRPGDEPWVAKVTGTRGIHHAGIWSIPDEGTELVAMEDGASADVAPATVVATTLRGLDRDGDGQPITDDAIETLLAAAEGGNVAAFSGSLQALGIAPKQIPASSLVAVEGAVQVRDLHRFLPGAVEVSLIVDQHATAPVLAQARPWSSSTWTRSRRLRSRSPRRWAPSTPRASNTSPA